MNLQERQYLQSEISKLDEMLGHIPETHVIDRMSLQSRKDAVLAELEALPANQPASAMLTFLGKPVVSSYGIFAEFAAQAVNKFADAVVAFAASSVAPLGARGAIPNREKYQLLITGTALGSFGFELQEYQPQTLLEGLSVVGQAIEQVRKFMEATLGSDDDLADAATETSERAVTALHEFLRMMADNEAVCALAFRDRVFRFSDVGQVRQSAERLSQDNIHEEERWLEGNFQGVLPKRRTFEFRITGTGEIIVGKVGFDIPDASTINHILEQPVRILVRGTRIGDGRPRYILIRYEEEELEMPDIPE